MVFNKQDVYQHQPTFNIRLHILIESNDYGWKSVQKQHPDMETLPICASFNQYCITYGWRSTYYQLIWNIRTAHVEIILCFSNTFMVNPLGTSGLLTPFLIGSYHEMFTCLANYDKSLKMLHHKLTYETIFTYYLHPL